MSENLDLSDFSILQILGQGSFSQVKLVRRRSDGKLLALKQVIMNKISMEQKNMSLNEVRLLASINSPYIISYQGSFYSSCTNSLCLLMQYADSGDLLGIINKFAEKNRRRKGLPQDFIWRTTYQMLQGLKTLHENKIAHRDIKPANIFFGKGIAKLGDLNVSSFSANCFYSTKTGTPYYTSPQIWNGHKYTTNCDIWSLGCIIYQMCTLFPPFRGQNFPQLFHLVQNGKYEEISSDYSSQLKNFIRNCLIIDQYKRPSAKQLLETEIIKIKSVDYKQESQQNGKVDLMKPIKCPKVLKFVNSVLPKKKISITEKQDILVRFEKGLSEEQNDQKSNSRITNRGQSSKRIKSSIRIRSNKNIKAPIYPKSQKQIKAQLTERCQKQQMKKKQEISQSKIQQKITNRDQKCVNAIKNTNFRLRSYKKIGQKQNCQLKQI